MDRFVQILLFWGEMWPGDKGMASEEGRTFYNPGCVSGLISYLSKAADL